MFGVSSQVVECNTVTTLLHHFRKQSFWRGPCPSTTGGQRGPKESCLYSDGQDPTKSRTKHHAEERTSTQPLLCLWWDRSLGSLCEVNIHRAVQQPCGINVSKNSFIESCVSPYRHGGEMVHNEVAGYDMRTKNIEHDGGGIVCGISVFDTPLLIWTLALVSGGPDVLHVFLHVS